MVPSSSSTASNRPCTSSVQCGLKKCSCQTAITCFPASWLRSFRIQNCPELQPKLLPNPRLGDSIFNACDVRDDLYDAAEQAKRSNQALGIVDADVLVEHQRDAVNAVGHRGFSC